ncbi:MAG: hypothetical protein ACFFDB_00375 [Promethearchaeota archaeon]
MREEESKKGFKRITAIKQSTSVDITLFGHSLAIAFSIGINWLYALEGIVSIFFLILMGIIFISLIILRATDMDSSSPILSIIISLTFLIVSAIVFNLKFFGII